MIGAVSPASRISGVFAGLALPVAGGAVLAMAAASLIAQPIWGDQSWYLYAAGRVLDGAHVGATDVVDVNPPLIIWLSELPVALSRALGVLPQTALKLCLAVLATLSAGWCALLVRRTMRAQAGAMGLWLATAILYAAMVHPWLYLGQREHIMVLAVLPYLVIAAVRLEGGSLAAWEAALAGLVAALGFSLKPQHLLIVAGVEGFLVLRRGSLRSLLRPETTALALGGLGYCAAVWLFAPEYIVQVVPYAYEAYLDYMRAPLAAMIEPMRAAKIAGFIVLWALLRRHLRYRGLCAVLAIAGIGATIAYVVQHKGIEYQFLPALAFFTILLGVMIADGLLRWASGVTQPIDARRAGVVALASGLAVGVLYFPIQSARAAHHWINDRVATQQRFTALVPGGTTILVLSPSASTIFDFLLDHHLKWGSRFPSLWMLPAILGSEPADPAGSDVSQPVKLARVAHWTRDAVVADLQRWHPSLVLVERCADRSISPCVSMETLRVDLLAWLRRDSAFRTVWADYQRRRRIGPYDLWCSKRDEAACSRVLAALPSAVSSRDP